MPVGQGPLQTTREFLFNRNMSNRILSNRKTKKFKKKAVGQDPPKVLEVPRDF